MTAGVNEVENPEGEDEDEDEDDNEDDDEREDDDEGGVAVRLVRETDDVESVPTVTVVKTESGGGVNTEDGIGIEDVALASGDSKLPSMSSRLNVGEY